MTAPAAETETETEKETGPFTGAVSLFTVTMSLAVDIIRSKRFKAQFLLLNGFAEAGSTAELFSEAEKVCSAVIFPSGNTLMLYVLESLSRPCSISA